jgi:uncharacterized protein YpmB
MKVVIIIIIIIIIIMSSRSYVHVSMCVSWRAICQRTLTRNVSDEPDHSQNELWDTHTGTWGSY